MNCAIDNNDDDNYQDDDMHDVVDCDNDDDDDDINRNMYGGSGDEDFHTMSDSVTPEVEMTHVD